MAVPTGSDHTTVDEMLQQLEAENINVATFLDEGFRPRQLPDPTKPVRWARSDRPLTRILEPREYPTYTFPRILELVKKAGTVDTAKAALRTAVEYRKSLVTQGSFFIQVLPRDFDYAMKRLNGATVANNGKRVAESPPPEMRPQKQRALNESTPKGNESCEDDPSQGESSKPRETPSVVKHMADVPELLAKILRTMRNMKKGPASVPEIAIKFNSGQSESELYGLFINSTTFLRTSCIEDEDYDIRQQTEVHCHKHWIYKISANEASRL